MISRRGGGRIDRKIEGKVEEELKARFRDFGV
jgi:hypothetical protein